MSYLSLVAAVATAALLGMVAYSTFTIPGKARNHSEAIAREFKGMGQAESVFERRIRGLLRVAESGPSEESELSRRTLDILCGRRDHVGQAARVIVESPVRLLGPDDGDLPFHIVPQRKVTLSIGAIFFIFAFIAIVVMDYTSSAPLFLGLFIPGQLLLAILFFGAALHERLSIRRNQALIRHILDEQLLA